MWNLFTESFKLEFSDIHFIFGPNRDEMTNPNKFFHKDPETCEYDCEDQTNNIVLMHKIVHEIRRPQRDFEKMIAANDKAYRKK